jgi:hypothetical protein
MLSYRKNIPAKNVPKKQQLIQLNCLVNAEASVQGSGLGPEPVLYYSKLQKSLLGQYISQGRTMYYSECY